MSSDKTNYKSMMKGTAIFGGVQVFNILAGILRGKFVAIILGASGMGIISLYTTACNVIQQFSTLGLNVAAVKDIAAANENGDKKCIASIVKALRRAVLITATIGAIVTIVLSKCLSSLTFGTTEYSWSFIFLSLFIFATVLSNGENAILQGNRRLKTLALCNVTGAILGLVIGVPFYYWFGEKGIVPSMIISGVILYLFTRLGTHKIDFVRISQTYKDSWTICKNMLAIGVIMTIGLCLGNLAQYSIAGSIRFLGTVADVGLYNAANSITMQSVGLVFTAMATDYFPRLSATISDRDKTLTIVRQQTEIVVLVVAPIAAFMLLVAPLLIKLLLTYEFLVTTDIVRYLSYGIIFKAFCFPMGYLAVAKSDKIYYLLTDGVWTNIKTPLLFVGFYYFYGFSGLGYAALCNSLLDVIVVTSLTKWRYGISLGYVFYKMSLPIVILLTLSLFSSFIYDSKISSILMIIVLIIISIYSIYELNKRVDLYSWIKNRGGYKIKGR